MSFIRGWKKVRDFDDPQRLTIAELLIPHGALTVCVSNHWRSDRAYVVAVEGASAGVSVFDAMFLYRPGEWVISKNGVDPDPTTTFCAGIHYYRERERLSVLHLRNT